MALNVRKIKGYYSTLKYNKKSVVVLVALNTSYYTIAVEDLKLN